MPSLTLTSVQGSGSSGGGGIKPCTVLHNASCSTENIVNGIWSPSIGVTKSSSISSATLATIINIPDGSGYLTFGGIIRGGNVNSAGYKLKITIDGVVALDVTSGATLSQYAYHSQIGYYGGSSVNGYSEGMVVFNESLKIEIAGTGAGGNVAYAYKLYRT